MTAVQGIELLPPKESERLPAREVKSKGEVSPFEKLLTNNKPPENTESQPSEKQNQSNPSPVKDGPDHPSFYSTEKLTALLKGITFDQNISEEHNIQTEGLMMPAALWETENTQNNGADEMKKIISLILKGKMGSEELEKLISSNLAAAQAAGQAQAVSSDPSLEMTMMELKEKMLSPEESDGKSLNGLLTEEGELIYFDESALYDENKSLKGIKNSQSKVLNQSGSKVVMEISVTDLRGGKGQIAPELAANQENQVLNASLEGEKGESIDPDITENLLNTPAEKLFSAEGAGGKLQAPVSREVSRMFQNYMKETGSRDLVKKIDFILKNNNQGEIKLILKPEALGNVRINLSLNENHIAGKIFVDNSSVRQIFLENMEQITNQLKANGYEEASLEVWVGQEGQSGQKDRQESEQNKDYRTAERIKRFDQSVPQAAPGSYVNEGEINLVV